MRIVLVRHPTPLIAPELCYGRLDVEADPDARRHLADMTVRHMEWAGRVWSSPARRCRGLAEHVAHTLAAPLNIDARLQELDFGEWEGCPWDQISRADLDRWAACPLGFAPPGGETGADLLARVRDFHACLCHDHQSCVVVSHGGPLKLLAALLLGTPVDLLAVPPSIGSVTCLVA